MCTVWVCLWVCLWVSGGVVVPPQIAVWGTLLYMPQLPLAFQLNVITRWNALQCEPHT